MGKGSDHPLRARIPSHTCHWHHASARAMRPRSLSSSTTVAVSPRDTSTTTAWHATSVEAARTVVIIVGNMLTDDVLMGGERRHGIGWPLAPASCSPSDTRSGPDRGPSALDRPLRARICHHLITHYVKTAWGWPVPLGTVPVAPTPATDNVRSVLYAYCVMVGSE